MFDTSYFSGRTIEGLAPAVDDHRNSGFRAILKHVRFGPGARILEIGGGTGQYTTVHLLDMFDVPIDIVEVDKDRAVALEAKVGEDPVSRGRVHIHNVDARKFDAAHKYDLVAIDLPTGWIWL